MSIIKKVYHKLPTNAKKRVRKIVKCIRGDYKTFSNRSISKSEIVDDLKNMGVRSGDVLYVQSSLRSIGNVEGGVDTIINALTEVIGHDGTLAMPAFSMPVGGMVGTLEKNEIFDPNTTPSTVGLIPETFRKRSGVLRSIHPTSSVCAFGAKAKIITEGHNEYHSNFGVGTPLYEIIEVGGKTLGIGVELDKVSFYHTAEDVIKPFPIKTYMDKVYNVKVIDTGKIKIMNVTPLDPKVARTRIDKRPRGDWIRNFVTEFLIDRGVVKFGYIGDARSWIMNIKEFFDAYKELLERKITIYTTEDVYKAAGQKLIHYITNYQSMQSGTRHNYLGEQVLHIKKGYKQKGFWDTDCQNWIRQLNWTGTDWVGYVPHDWKYAVELQEGGTHYAMETGDATLDENLKKELGYIHSKIDQDGKIDGVPSGQAYSSEEYEYGTTLSSLALGYLYFKDKDPKLTEQILHDINKLYKFTSSKFTPTFEDHHSVILRAYANLLLVYKLLDDTEHISRLQTEIHNYAMEFINHQLKDGLFPFKPREYRTAVQNQLKADIALLLANKATGSDEYLLSAKKNFDWVIRNLLLPNGGLKWNTKNTETFFEIHQMLFLICSRYLYILSSGRYGYTPNAISAWKFLVDHNSAEIDMYVHNYNSTGAFFSYRCVDNKGNVQSKDGFGAFKGSYEIGYTLWALALNKDLAL